MNNYVLYNPKANSGNCLENAKILTAILNGEVNFIDILTISSYERFFNGLGNNDKVIICGGDGTVNKFINAIDGIDVKVDLYYYPCGTGNDFYNDVAKPTEEIIKLNDLIKNLPTCIVNGEKHKFINGVGFGIDGFCCAEGDILREKGKKANYTSIAIKGLLYKYKPCNAKITVDGTEYTYNKVWLAPTMFGKYYGGGMIPTPGQNRNSDKVSILVFHGSGKLNSLMIFPSIFKGEHVKNKKHVEVLSGNNIKVEFAKETPLQIDGETILNVLNYQVIK